MQVHFTSSARDLSGIHCLICLACEFFFANQGGTTAQVLGPFGQVSALLQGVDCTSDDCPTHPRFFLWPPADIQTNVVLDKDVAVLTSLSSAMTSVQSSGPRPTAVASTRSVQINQQ